MSEVQVESQTKTDASLSVTHAHHHESLPGRVTSQALNGPHPHSPVPSNEQKETTKHDSGSVPITHTHTQSTSAAAPGQRPGSPLVASESSKPDHAGEAAARASTSSQDAATATRHEAEAQSIEVDQHGEASLDDVATLMNSEASQRYHDMSPLNKEQLKYCQTIVKSLKRHKEAGPFLAPVDPVVLNIPDYLDVVKEPMDLASINAKLSDHQYASAEHFVNDVRLMLNNCFAYNPPGTVVHNMGRNLEKAFDTMMKKLPKEAPRAESALEEASERGSRRASMASHKKRSLSIDEEIQSPKRRDSAVHKSPSTPTSGKFKNPSSAEDLKYCGTILKEFAKKQNLAITYPFTLPVDPVALGIPDYFSVIKHPMDLSTMKSKLESKAYPNADDFKADFELMCANCLRYNAPDTDVVRCCQAVQDLFAELWRKRPSQVGTAYDDEGGSSGHHHHHAGSHYDSDDDHIAKLRKKIEALQSEIEALQSKKRRASTAPGSSSKRHPGRPPSSAVAHKRERSSAAKEMSFEEKRDLSLEINELPSDKLVQVVEIIHKGMPSLKDNNTEEMELDIEVLDAKTLQALARYVKSLKAETTGTDKKKLKNSSGSGSASGRPSAAALDSSDDTSGEDDY